MPAGVTYNCLATATSSGSSSSVVFSSISQSYTDLILVLSGKMATVSYFDVQFNGDTGSNYAFVRMIGFGTTVYTDRYNNFSSWQPNLSETQGTCVITMNNYSNTTTYKSGIFRDSNASQGVESSIGLWKNTSAISTITISNGGAGNIPAGTNFTLYGIAAA